MVLKSVRRYQKTAVPRFMFVVASRRKQAGQDIHAVCVRRSRDLEVVKAVSSHSWFQSIVTAKLQNCTKRQAMAFSHGFSRRIHRHMVLETSIYLRATPWVPTELQARMKCCHVLLEAAQSLVRYLYHDSVYQVASFLQHHRAALHTKITDARADVSVRARFVKNGIFGRMCSKSPRTVTCSLPIYSRVPNYFSCGSESAVTRLRWPGV